MRWLNGETFAPPVWLAVVLALAGLEQGCTLFSSQPRAPQPATPALPSNGPRPTGTATAVEWQAKVMSFADGLIYALAESCTDIEPQLTTPRERAVLQMLKLHYANTALLIASGPNPTANLLDMVALVTLGRENVEHYWLPEVLGPRAAPLLTTLRQLETEIWSTAGRLLTPSQQEEFRALLREWRETQPGPRAVEFVYLSEFARARHATATTRSLPGSLLGWFFLDPLASLDPATRSIEETRQVAERSLFFLKRAPTLLRWQTELFAHNVLALPETGQLLADLTGFRAATEKFVQVVDQLPQRFGAEQQQLLAAVLQEDERWRGLLAEARDLATAVADAASALDTFAGRWQRPSPTHAEAAAVSSRPFDVREYGAAATEIARGAQELTRLVESCNDLLAAPIWEQRQADAAALAERVETLGERLLQRAFLYGLALIAALTVGLIIARRWSGRPRD